MGELNAIKYDWGNYCCYLGTLLYSDVPKYIRAKSDQSMNRTINDSRVSEIMNYIEKNLSNTFFPPVILNSSKKIDYDNSTFTLKVNNNDLTIIDGQHRIKAINDMMNGNGEYKNNIRNFTLPFLLVENLEPEIHRNLFNTINENATNVETTVSERFSTKTRNLIGLRYISENSDVKPLIEWELKMSQEKIVYLHMTLCNDEIEDCIKKILKDQPQINSELLYKEDYYYSIFKTFWDIIFNHIKKQTDLSRSFWIKAITLTAITKQICEEIKADSSIPLNSETFPNLCGIISEKITTLLKEYLVERLVFIYKGSTKRSDKTNRAVIDYIETNKNLLTEGLDLEELSKPQLQDLLNGYVALNCLQDNLFTSDNGNYDLIKKLCVHLLKKKNEFLDKPQNAFKTLNKVQAAIPTLE